MTIDIFIAWAEAYYGKYKPLVKMELKTWLEGKSAAFLFGVREMVKENYSNQYRQPPDIAILNSFKGIQETYDRGYKVMERIEEKERMRQILDITGETCAECHRYLPEHNPECSKWVDKYKEA